MSDKSLEKICEELAFKESPITVVSTCEWKETQDTLKKLQNVEKELHKFKNKKYDFESRTGISTKLFFKALDKGICYKNGERINWSYHLMLYKNVFGEFEFHILEERLCNRIFTVKLSDYKKTWALVGEENLL